MSGQKLDTCRVNGLENTVKAVHTQCRMGMFFEHTFLTLQHT